MLNVKTDGIKSQTKIIIEYTCILKQSTVELSLNSAYSG